MPRWWCLPVALFCPQERRRRWRAAFANPRRANGHHVCCGSGTEQSSLDAREYAAYGAWNVCCDEEEKSSSIPQRERLRAKLSSMRPAGRAGTIAATRKCTEKLLRAEDIRYIAFRPDHLEGNLPTPGAVSAQIHGVFSLHGSGTRDGGAVQAGFYVGAVEGNCEIQSALYRVGAEESEQFLS